MAPVGDSLAGELSVPRFGRRDGVGMCESTGILLSTVLVGMVPRTDVGGEEVIKGAVFKLRHAPWGEKKGNYKRKCNNYLPTHYTHFSM